MPHGIFRTGVVRWLCCGGSPRFGWRSPTGDPQIPVLSSELPLEVEGGRGLVLVDAVADKWGVDPVAGWQKGVVRVLVRRYSLRQISLGERRC